MLGYQTYPYFAKHERRKRRVLQIFWKLQRRRFPIVKSPKLGSRWRCGSLGAKADRGGGGLTLWGAPQKQGRNLIEETTV